MRPKNPLTARRAADTIFKALQVLGLQPQIGRPVEDMPDQFREWVVDFGDSGYVARYRFDGEAVTKRKSAIETHPSARFAPAGEFGESFGCV